MAKIPTYPTLYNDVKFISITKLKQWEYFDLEQVKSGIITWSRNGNQIGSISIKVNTKIEQPYIELEYNFRDKPRCYKVRLVSMPSNLGKGVIWYFLCPTTNKRCRKLYSIGGYFLHREAFKGCMYDCQTQSKKNRQLDKTLGIYFKIDCVFEEINKKHFKKYYAGKPTKRYLKLNKLINQADNLSIHEILNAIR